MTYDRLDGCLNCLKRLDVIPAGAHTFSLAPRTRAVALERLLEDLDPIA
jgi:hypothetical protein